MSYDNDKLQQIIEGALLAAGEALNIDKLLSLFEEHELPEKSDIQSALAAIQESCESRGFILKEVASGWRFQVKEELATWVNRLWEEKPQKYSRALLETLALVAYRQPITRGDIEEVRGVAVSSHIIKTLTEREWIKVVGHRDVPGRPALYATSKQFLDYFNLKSLEELPTLGELRDIEELNASLDFEQIKGGDEESADDVPVETNTQKADDTPSGVSVSAEDAPPAEEEAQEAVDAVNFEGDTADDGQIENDSGADTGIEPAEKYSEPDTNEEVELDGSESDR